jgi:hypothetical protein
MLLVVSSLLNAAAIVVYVNKEQTTTMAAEALRSANTSLQRDKAQSDNAAAAARAELTRIEQVDAAQAAAQQANLDKAAADLAAKDADYKQLLRANQAQEANLQGTNAQLAIALETNKQQSQTVNDVRDKNNTLVQSQAESDAALARQRQLAETYGRQVQYLDEQIKKAQDLIKAYSAVITDHHLTVPTADQAAVSFSGPAVSGTVQDKQYVNGVTYLTISVGSADNVHPGMQFRVVDASTSPSQFLGLLTITQADPNSSIGRLQAEAPAVQKVSKGDEVTSDIQ